MAVPRSAAGVAIERRQIIVLGMHRSGTSAVTGLLRSYGAHVGEESELTQPNRENPRGFFERRDMRQICDSLLAEAGADWWKPGRFESGALGVEGLAQAKGFQGVVAELDRHGTWAVKEPRLCYLLPALMPHLSDPVAVFIVRNPLEVARSLRERNGFSTHVGLALWEAYNVAALASSDVMPRVFVNYHELVADPAGAGEALRARLTSFGVAGLDAARGRDGIDRSLHRQVAESREIADLTTPAQKELWAALSAGDPGRAVRTVSPAARLVLEEFDTDETARISREKKAASQFRATLETMTRKVESLRDMLRKQRAEADSLTSSLRKVTGRLWKRDEEIGQLLLAVHAARNEARILAATAGSRVTQPFRRAIDEMAWMLRSGGRLPLLLWWLATLQSGKLGHERSIARDEALLGASALFDRDWYLATYPDIGQAGIDPLAHFCRWGAAEGRDPHPMFDCHWYRSRNPDAAGVNALAHYLRYGAIEGRDPHPDFSTRAYLAMHQDVARQGINPLEHYVRTGRAEGRATRPSGAQYRHGLEKLVGPEISRSVFGKRLSAIVARNFPLSLAHALAESEATVAGARERLSGLAERPLVSIVMPTHNRAQIIGEAISSVIEQDYTEWELLVCDDASTDATAEIVAGFKDARIRHIALPRGGAAAARNAGLREMRGTIVAYLDTDNYWHPGYLGTMVHALLECPGRSAVYAGFIDFQVNAAGETSLRSYERAPFDHERLLARNYIDLNTFVHKRELYDCFGGFNEKLKRRQDYDLILKYTWLRDPLQLPCLLTLYQRNDNLDQITRLQRFDNSCMPIIDGAIAGYLKSGLPVPARRPVRSVTVLSWDACRNHFAKAYSVAEALSARFDVQLVSFLFFENEGIFPPLRDAQPKFETLYLPGGRFPDFFKSMARAVAAIRGDAIYVVKPRLPSLGVALLANAERGVPFMLEVNDLETLVASPKRSDRHAEADWDEIDLSAPDLLNPYSELWSQLMDPLARQLPTVITHNQRLDLHFANRSLYMRNIKDGRIYDPARFDRHRIRADLGYAPDDRVILFGGLVRKHKGIYELVELVKRLGDPRYKLLFVGSRPTPDQEHIMKAHGGRIRMLPSQDPQAMAGINLASDLVVLWLDPEVPASHFQFPYKATDALAMGTPIIANDISDLGELGRQGYLSLVPFGDWPRMVEAVRAIFESPDAASRMRDAGRRMFQRQFSYPAAVGNFELAATRALEVRPAVLPVAEQFARRFSEFYRACGAARASGTGESPPRS